MTTPTELRALADRVCAEEPSDKLQDAVLLAFGWEELRNGSWRKFYPPGSYDDRHWANLPTPLHSLDDAAAMMPAGWRIRDMLEQAELGWTVEVWKIGLRRIIVTAPTEPRARTAAALRAMAADMEDADAPMTPNHADHTVIGKLRWTANDHLYFGKIYVGRVFRDIFGTYQVVPENWVSLRRMDMPTRDDACAALVQAVKEAIND